MKMFPWNSKFFDDFFYSIRRALPLFLILILAAFLRVWGIDTGLAGRTVMGDEEQIVVRALRFGWGDLNPHWFLYPSLFMYINFVLFGFFFVVGWFCGIFSSPEQFGLSFFAHPERFYIIARSLSSLLGIGTVLLTYATTRRLVRNHYVGLLAALFLAVSLFHVTVSQSAKPDSAMMFFLVLSFYYAVVFWEDRLPRNAILAGAACGMSISMKYPAGLILLPVLYAILQYARWSWYKRLTVSGLCVGAAVIAFVVGTPFAVLDFSEFTKWMWWVKGHADLVWRGGVYNEYRSFSTYLFHFWPKSNGYILALLSLAGIASFSYRRGSKAVFVGLFPLTYFLFMGRSILAASSYFTPLTPFLAIYAAYGMVFISPQAGHWQKRAIIFFAAIAVVQPLFSVIQRQYNRLAPDTMSVASEWIKRNIPDGERLLAVNVPPNVNLSRECLLEVLNKPFTDGTVPEGTVSAYTGRGMHYRYLLNNILKPSYYVRTVPQTMVFRRRDEFPALLDEFKLDRYVGFRCVVIASLASSDRNSVGRLSPVVHTGETIPYREDVIRAYDDFLRDISNSCTRLLLVTSTNSPPMKSDSFIFRFFFSVWGRPGNQVEIFQMASAMKSGPKS